MEIKALRSFICIANLKSFSRAAEELRIAQPALSRQIRKLESELGTALLRRHARGVELTEAGAIVFKRAEHLIGAVGGIKEEIASTTRFSAGRLVMGVPPGVGSIVVPPLLERLRASGRDVSIHFLEGVGGPLQEWALSGKVDLALVHNPKPSYQLVIKPLVQEAMFILSGPQHNSRPDGYDIREIGTLPLVLPTYPHYSRFILERAAAQYGFRLRVALEVDGGVLTRSLIAAGYGYGVGVYSPAVNDIALGRLVASPIKGRKLHSTVSLVYRSDSLPSAARTIVIRAIEEVIRKLVHRGAWPGDVKLVRGTGSEGPGEPIMPQARRRRRSPEAVG